MRVLHLLAEPRPEGGAVRLFLTLPQGYPWVRVLRTPEGTPLAGPEDPGGFLVWDGPPRPSRAYPFVREPRPSLPEGGEVWDLEAFPAAFGEERRPLEGGRWTYHVWPKTPEGQYGEPATATVAVRREAEARLVLDVKRVLYQRLRFHGEARGVFVALQEHVHEQKPLPQALIKARYALAERAFGDRDLTATFRAVAEVLLLAESPGQRDELALYFTARLLADFPLLEALGWDGLTLTRADRMLDLGSAVLYGAEMALEGILDAYAAYGRPYRIGDYTLEWRVGV